MDNDKEEIIFSMLDEEEMVEFIYNKVKEEDRMITKSRIRLILNAELDFYESKGILDLINDLESEEDDENE